MKLCMHDQPSSHVVHESAYSQLGFGQRHINNLSKRNEYIVQRLLNDGVIEPANEDCRFLPCRVRHVVASTRLVSLQTIESIGRIINHQYKCRHHKRQDPDVPGETFGQGIRNQQNTWPSYGDIYPRLMFFSVRFCSFSLRMF